MDEAADGESDYDNTAEGGGSGGGGGDRGGGSGSGGGGRKNKKGRNKPWKMHGRRLGGDGGGGGAMHDANVYRHYRPDFRELAREYPDTFGPYVIEDPDTGRMTIDWKDPSSMRELTRVMLLHDFDILHWDVPLDRLCPPVANRLNYICWLSDLMKLSQQGGGDGGGGGGCGGGGGGGDGGGDGGMSAAERNLLLFGTSEGGEGVRPGAARGAVSVAVCDLVVDVESGGRGDPNGRGPPRRGIDIGTGASCIYPLLGAKVSGWSFLATETDAVSAEWADKNVRSNDLHDQVTVRVVPSSDATDQDAPGPLLTALTEEDGDFDFSMTNPPFFESEEEVREEARFWY
ncbi:unnamed protein product [Laminaria digitata]